MPGAIINRRSLELLIGSSTKTIYRSKGFANNVLSALRRLLEKKIN